MCTFAKSLLSIVSVSLFTLTVNAQCPLPSSGFGGGTAPSPGNSVVLETCAFVGEYVTAVGVQASDTYTVNFSGGNGVYVVVYDTNDQPIAWGNYTVQFTATQTGEYHSAVFMDSLCDDNDPNFSCNSNLWMNTTSNVGLQSMEYSAFSIFPNPTSEHVSISFEGSSAKLMVSDIHGKMVYSTQVKSGDKVDLTSFEAGIYFFNLEMEGKNETIRIIRQ